MIGERVEVNQSCGSQKSNWMELGISRYIYKAGFYCAWFLSIIKHLIPCVLGAQVDKRSQKISHSGGTEFVSTYAAVHPQNVRLYITSHAR